MYIYLLFAKIILLDTIYSLKFLQSCFYSLICTLKYYNTRDKFSVLLNVISSLNI